MAGHSLGEYTALAAADSITLKDCANLLKNRGKYMQNADPENISGMLAVIGLDINNLNIILNTIIQK